MASLCTHRRRANEYLGIKSRPKIEGNSFDCVCVPLYDIYKDLNVMSLLDAVTASWRSI